MKLKEFDMKKQYDPGQRSFPSESRETPQCLCGVPLNYDDQLLRKCERIVLVGFNDGLSFEEILKLDVSLKEHNFVV